MMKKFLLVGLLLNPILLMPAASNTDFDKAELRRALDLINKADEKPFLKKWYAQNIENRFKAAAMFHMLEFICGAWLHNLIKTTNPEKYEELKKDCNDNLEDLNGLFIRPLKDLNTPESNELAEIFERKAQSRRRLLNVPKIVPTLNLEDVVTEDDVHIKEKIAMDPSFDAKSHIEHINICQNCVGTGKTVYPTWCNIQRKVYEMQSFLLYDQDEAQSIKMARVARNIKAEFEKAGERLEPSDIDQKGIIHSYAELDSLIPGEYFIPQDPKEQEKILKLINICQTNDLAHHSDALGEKCQSFKDAFQYLSNHFKQQNSCKEQLKCESIVSNIEMRQAEAKVSH